MSVRRSALPLVQLAPEQLEVATFLGVVLIASWPLMVAPRSSGLGEVATFVPGVAAVALAVRAHGVRGAVRRLSLNRLGWPDAYFMAIWVPVLMAIGQIAVIVTLRAGQLDPDLGGLHPASGAPPTIDATWGLVTAVLIVPLATMVLMLGTELGWRAYVLPRLVPALGSWRAITATSLMWALWQMPLVIDVRSASWPIEAVTFLFWCLFVGEILGWLYLRTRSAWAPALFAAAVASSAYLPKLLIQGASPDAASAFGPAALIVPAVVVLLIRDRFEGEVHAALAR